MEIQNGNGKNKNGLNSDKPALKFLFVSWESLSGDLAWQIKNEGHEVKVYVKSEEDQDVYDGFLEKVSDWKLHIDWADVIVFDDVGFGSLADDLRKKGKLVVGGSVYTDRLEEDREFGQYEMKKNGLLILPHWDFNDYDAALTFIEQNPGRYVYKPSGSLSSDSKGILFLGREEDGKDLYEIIRSNKKVLTKKQNNFSFRNSLRALKSPWERFSTVMILFTRSISILSTKNYFPGTSARLRARWELSCTGPSPISYLRQRLRNSNQRLKIRAILATLISTALLMPGGFILWNLPQDSDTRLSPSKWREF